MADGRAVIRDAVATWFAPPNVAGLNKVFTGMPKEIVEQEFFTSVAAGTPSAAIAYVDITNDKEERIATGYKRLTASTWLVVKFMSNRDKSEDAIADHDALVDAIKARLRGPDGRTLGGKVFSAGEGDQLGAPDVEVDGGSPTLVEETTWIWCAVKFTTVVMLPGT